MLAPPSEILKNAGLFLDFDGTLVDIAPTPDAVVVDRAIHDLLALLVARHRGAVAIISGRSIAQLDDLLGDSALRVMVSGSHGVEQRGSGMLTRPERPCQLDEAEARFRAIARDQDGVVVEAKSYGVALHYRLAPHFSDEARSQAAKLASEFGLLLQEGKMMVELRAPGDDKGMAVRKLMRCGVMDGRRPVFLGDDITDEVGFLAARDAGGHGILVGPPRETHANFALPNPAAARDWLASGPQ